MAGNENCSNCGAGTEKGNDQCPFCIKYGENDPKKLSEIKLFSAVHNSKGLCEALNID